VLLCFSYCTSDTESKISKQEGMGEHKPIVARQ
jgi:hypothetical protein